jgi:hypothetical protein
MRVTVDVPVWVEVAVASGIIAETVLGLSIGGDGACSDRASARGGAPIRLWRRVLIKARHSAPLTENPVLYDRSKSQSGVVAGLAIR